MDAKIALNFFSVTFYLGDIMGPALTNLEGLLSMPVGCGEQNLANFSPNIYILDYLTNTNQVTKKIKDDALRYITKGIQIVWNYEFLLFLEFLEFSAKKSIRSRYVLIKKVSSANINYSCFKQTETKDFKPSEHSRTLFYK